MPDAKQRRATVSGGSPTFERNSLMVEDPVIRPKSQAINLAERDAALAILAASENSLQSKAKAAAAAEMGVGVEDGAKGRSTPVLRKTSSESSSGQKGPSESEMEDSVFSSDKEDKDPQLSKRSAGAEAKRQEFRVAKPTAMLLDPGSANILPTSASSPPTRHTSSSSSSVSSSTSSSTLVTASPNPQTKAKHGGGEGRGAGGSASLRKHSPTPKHSAVSKTASSGSERNRPPSPVSAPPKRKKPSVTREGSQGGGRPRGEKPAVPEKSEQAIKRASLTRESMKIAAAAAARAVRAGPDSDSGLVSQKSLTDDKHSATGVVQAAHSDTHSTKDSPRDSSSSTVKDSSTTLPDSTRPEKARPYVLEARRDSQDNRPSAIQHAIHTEVATDAPSKDTPQLMKIKRIESPKASDAPHSILSSEEPDAVPKHKKKVEFSADSKEPPEVSYTHIIVAGVVQKIPIQDKHGVESPPVKMRQKPGSRRLDRRVSCKDLGKGDCEGWLLKRKEKDTLISKHWSKRWCVLKNANLYYYKNKDELRAEGVIFLPAFQVSPAPDVSKKKFAFKVHNAGTTFYFASERQEDMSKWMNKMGLAAINFDTSEVVSTGGFIKPEPPRSDRLGVANNYYSESEDEESNPSLHGSMISLNSLNSTTGQPSPPTPKRPAALQTSDLGFTHNTVMKRPVGQQASDPEGQRTGGSRH